MSGQVLIVDGSPARTLLMRATLQATHYEVSQASDVTKVPALLADAAPDLLLLDMGGDEAAAIAAIDAVKRRPSPATPVIAVVPPGRPDLRLDALRAGADEAMDRGGPNRLLQARIRSLLRARDAAAELNLRDEDDFAVGPTNGLAEPRAAFAEAAPGGARVAIMVAGRLAPGPTFPRPDRRRHDAARGGGERVGGDRVGRIQGAAPPAALADLHRALACDVAVLSSGDDPGIAEGGVPDLFVIDGSEAGADPEAGAEVLRLLADLRSRSITRHAATLVVLPESAVETAAMALDLGAGDVAGDGACPEELAARALALIGRKSQADRLRERVQSRLRAAVRDPLTGLYNRRYAEPTLQRMAAQARATGSELAMMVLDIDHFKAINDGWGHAAGDRVLAEVARRLQGAVRGNDLVARIGGEEFLVAMTDTAADAAGAAAERLRRAIDSRLFAVEPALPQPREPIGALFDWSGSGAGAGPRRAGPATGLSVISAKSRAAGASSPPTVLPSGGDDAARGRAGELIPVTVSIGVAVGSPVDEGPLDLPDLFEKADGALYAAKAAGRNTVSMASGPGPRRVS